jgi:hypothetical protein
MSTYRQEYEREIARLKVQGGGWTDEQIEMMARRNVAFARGYDPVQS